MSLPRPTAAAARLENQRGFSYVELLVASMLLMAGLLTLSGMFLTGHSQVTGAGNTTMAMSAARQILEDVRRLPYDSLVNLHGFDTENPASLPADGPEREVARRWRYALAGDGVGWAFSADEQSSWPLVHNQGNALNAAGSIQAVQLSASVTEITITVAVPGKWRPIRLATRLARLSS